MFRDDFGLGSHCTTRGSRAVELRISSAAIATRIAMVDVIDELARGL